MPDLARVTDVYGGSPPSSSSSVDMEEAVQEVCKEILMQEEEEHEQEFSRDFIDREAADAEKNPSLLNEGSLACGSVPNEPSGPPEARKMSSSHVSASRARFQHQETWLEEALSNFGDRFADDEKTKMLPFSQRERGFSVESLENFLGKKLKHNRHESVVSLRYFASHGSQGGSSEGNPTFHGSRTRACLLARSEGGNDERASIIPNLYTPRGSLTGMPRTPVELVQEFFMLSEEDRLLDIWLDMELMDTFQQLQRSPKWDKLTEREKENVTYIRHRKEDFDGVIKNLGADFLCPAQMCVMEGSDWKRTHDEDTFTYYKLCNNEKAFYVKSSFRVPCQVKDFLFVANEHCCARHWFKELHKDPQVVRGIRDRSCQMISVYVSVLGGLLKQRSISLSTMIDGLSSPARSFITFAVAPNKDRTDAQFIPPKEFWWHDVEVDGNFIKVTPVYEDIPGAPQGGSQTHAATQSMRTDAVSAFNPAASTATMRSLRRSPSVITKINTATIVEFNMKVRLPIQLPKQAGSILTKMLTHGLKRIRDLCDPAFLPQFFEQIKKTHGEEALRRDIYDDWINRRVKEASMEPHWDDEDEDGQPPEN
uniref:START domain-containing protein n=1 Tax=Chromera velia CCMP2878 TaxID=1169474 RepID=A0A0G4I5V1_9ALVE|eukprot:Cvel_11202.t1-p1 / transcript=Cvel_11202.t1 / gene=Cvel_11202 / organism=Chromera_velia_CCMP2878 / gene_product=hypothetical protein / transcript_product=hypothetical protein / location=Cvel_scaffold696:35119-39136(+) / protein_length=594 / sequence_SO=supercontig / SO=protein_coding / is_pseudo=false